MGKHSEEPREKTSQREGNSRENTSQIQQLHFEIDELKKKNDSQKEKNKQLKQEIELLKLNAKQSDALNEKLNIKLKQIIEESQLFREQIFGAFKQNNKPFQVPISVNAIIENIQYLKYENSQLKLALEESINKYAYQYTLNIDLKSEIKTKELQVERQAESKALVQSTLAQQVYNLRCQNTDLQETNSTIRNECATLQQMSIKRKSKRQKSLKKQKSNRILKN